MIEKTVEPERPRHQNANRHECERDRTDSSGLLKDRRASHAAAGPFGGGPRHFLFEWLKQAGTKDVDEPPENRQATVGLVPERATGNDQKAVGGDSVDDQAESNLARSVRKRTALANPREQTSDSLISRAMSPCRWAR